MPLSVRRPARWSWRALLPWAVGLLPVIVGLIALRWQTERELQMQSEAAASQVLGHTERILDNLAGAAQGLLPLAGKPCAEASLALRAQAARVPFVRATLLFQNNRLYCTSLLGEYEEQVDPDDYTEGKLWLLPGNSLTPDRPLLIYRLDSAGRGVLATVDGEHLLSALRLSPAGLAVQLQVGEQWLEASGQVRSGPLPTVARTPVSLASTRYPITVHTGFSADPAWDYLLGHYPALLALLGLLGAFAGVLCHWQIRRASSPRAELERALLANEFVPFLQPVVREGDYRWAGAEVLMRWQHPRDGLVRPDLFIPYAEHTGQIVAMTRVLMDDTARSLAPFAGLLDDGFHIGFNITADHCRDLSLLHDCQRFLEQFPPGRVSLTLEVTERKLIEPTPITLELFDKLHEMGVKIALDDFGTGQSSLNYLRQFHFDYLKIDRSFVALVGADALSLHILDSIIELCGKLNLGIVAEGVETVAQRDYLAKSAVDFQQGYLFARPMPVADFLKSLAAGPGPVSLPPPTAPEIING
ncbi:EAL domain-containing protein [Pseudomonas cremoricolorata]|uniref:cyclic-guanylate-specific phosphodiesterase n=1 Tax=Pseudomonas cremoricolorata TaxID=157783 RepID=A0A089WX42_9PSED|nr:EAL domain-containing protein [Pseudomonas cremoricolorata]AIR91157.1 diguanylate phosphodiesterase [Pseudomonas cremoricolorata]